MAWPDANGVGSLTNDGAGNLGWAAISFPNQTVTLSGDATGSGATSLSVTVSNIQPPESGSVGQPLVRTATGVAFGVIPSSAVTGLVDAQTNAMLNSWQSIWGVTNWLYATDWTTNIVGVTFSNFAGLTWNATSGTPTVLYSTDGGTTWSAGGETLITNVPVKIGFFGGVGWPHILTNTAAVNADCGMTNVTFYGLGRADLFGHTNQSYGQSMQVGTPIWTNDAVPLWYVLQLAANNSWGAIAGQDVFAQGYGIHPSSTWNLQAPSTIGSTDTFSIKWLGQPILSLSESPAVSITNISVTLDATKTNALIKVPTNGLTVVPTLEYTLKLVPSNWAYLTNAGSVSGTNYQWTVPMKGPSMFLAAVVPSAAPAAAQLAGALDL